MNDEAQPSSVEAHLRRVFADHFAGSAGDTVCRVTRSAGGATDSVVDLVYPAAVPDPSLWASG